MISIHALLAESDLRVLDGSKSSIEISIHALLAESDTWQRGSRVTYVISIHALLAESDRNGLRLLSAFISIHALLAESDNGRNLPRRNTPYFYPRSPCGERRVTVLGIQHKVGISIHALLAESDRAF